MAVQLGWAAIFYGVRCSGLFALWPPASPQVHILGERIFLSGLEPYYDVYDIVHKRSGGIP